VPLAVLRRQWHELFAVVLRSTCDVGISSDQSVDKDQGPYSLLGVRRRKTAVVAQLRQTLVNSVPGSKLQLNCYTVAVLQT